jgi:hypothetical protein
MKAVAVQTLFIVMFIGMSIFFTFLVFSGWLGIQVPQLTSLSCAGSKIDYCSSWNKANNCQGQAPNWDTQHCGNPTSPDDCKQYCTGAGP